MAREKIPPFNLLLEGLGCLQLIGLSIDPEIVITCNLLEGQRNSLWSLLVASEIVDAAIEIKS